MAVINRAAELHDEVTKWRHHLHQMPELNFDLTRSAQFVANLLREFGCDSVVTGLAQTGIVAVVDGNLGPGPTIALRADMDALPIQEQTGLPYASATAGNMHACGHDGHTAMLLGAAKYLSETRNFPGRVVFVFQPDEEGGHGGKRMLDEGLMGRFGIDRIYGMHNAPGLAIGKFAIRPGSTMAATSEFFVEIEGVGGHAAKPHKAIDPIIIGGHLLTALQTIVSRSVDPLDSAVVSVTKFNAGTALNVIADKASLAGTIRTLNPDVAERVCNTIRTMSEHLAAAFSARISVTFEENAPATVNDATEASFSGDIAAAIVGEENLNRNVTPSMGGEDFAYMLQARPGSYIYVGNGSTANLHQPNYDFNDDTIPYGISYWIRLAEAATRRSLS